MTDSATACPTDDELLLFTQRELDAPRMRQVEEHLFTCWECREVAASIGQEDHGPQDAAAGNALGDRYVPISLLGQGGMGTVFDAYDALLDRRVAIKVLHAGKQGSASRDRILKEAKALASVSHPNVVRIYDVPTFEGGIMLVMEHLAGVTLDQWLSQQARTHAHIMATLYALGHGLCAAHKAGVVHGDVKPRNMLVGDGGKAWIIDFGLALLESDERKTALAGTPSYMAPELLAGAPSSPLSDQYSFCWVVRQVLTGALQTASSSDGRLGPAPSRGAAYVLRVVQRGLSPDPSARFPDMQQLLDAMMHRPAVRRWRLLSGVGAAVVITTLGAGAWQERQDKERACREATGDLSSVVNPQVMETIRQSFMATSSGDAETEWKKSHARVLQYAEEWRDAQDALCGTDRVTETQRPGSMSCLASSRHELAAFIHGLSTSSDALFRANPEALSHPQQCLLGEPDQPFPAEPDQVLLRRLAVVSGMVAAGRFDEALAQAQEVYAHAKKHASLPFKQRAAAQVGYTAMLMSQEALGATAYEDALVLATALGDADSMGTALLKLADIHSWKQRKAEAELAIRQAEALVPRARQRTVLNAHTLYIRGRMARMRGQPEVALENLQKVLAIFRADPSVRPVSESMVLHAIGLSLHELGHHQDALGYLHLAIASHQERVGPHHPEVGMVRGNMVLVYTKMHRFDEACDEAKRVVALLDGMPGASAHRKAVAANILGNALEKAGRLEEALKAYSKARTHVSEGVMQGVPLAQAIDAGIADTHRKLGHLQQAQEMYERTLEALREYPGAKANWTALAETGLAETLLARGQSKQAVPLAQHALTVWAGIGGQPVEKGQTHWVLARALWEQKKQVQALEEARAAVSVLQTRTGAPNPELDEVQSWLKARTGTASP